MSAEMNTDAVPPRLRPVPVWRRVLRLGFLVVIGVAVGVALVNRWEDISTELAAATRLPLAGAILSALVAAALTGGIWRAMLTGFGHRLGLAASVQIFFVGQLGKYVPGSIWPLVTQSELARDHRVPVRASFAAVTLFMWTHLVTGGIIAALTLPVTDVVPAPVALLALPGVALLSPVPLRWLQALLERLIKRRLFEQIPDGAAMAKGAAWAAAMWAAYSAHVLLALQAFGESAPPAAAAGAFAVAWCAGFLFIIAPAGAGVRDVLLVAILAPFAGESSAVAVALTSRLALVVSDVALGLAGLVTGRLRR